MPHLPLLKGWGSEYFTRKYFVKEYGKQSEVWKVEKFWKYKKQKRGKQSQVVFCIFYNINICRFWGIWDIHAICSSGRTPSVMLTALVFWNVLQLLNVQLHMYPTCHMTAWIQPLRNEFQRAFVRRLWLSLPISKLNTRLFCCAALSLSPPYAHGRVREGWSALCPGLKEASRWNKSVNSCVIKLAVEGALEGAECLSSQMYRMTLSKSLGFPMSSTF